MLGKTNSFSEIMLQLYIHRKFNILQTLQDENIKTLYKENNILHFM